ncbi:MAG: helix-turn-helix transcriptional regulator [Chloroflexi bacterium]|nr:helix-turn-helix transcriptional regulator [Chloroflexota bacterium]
MGSDREPQRARSAQVGFVMRAYREAFLEEDGRRGISQAELLRRMSAVDGSFAQRFSHATVTRWEAGTTRPTVERLRIFGKALNLSDDEVLGLIALAGLEQEPEPIGAHETGLESTPVSEELPESETHLSATETDVVVNEVDSPAWWSTALRFLSFRFLLPAACIGIGGFALNMLGWNNDWMPLAYVMMASLLVLAQAFVWTERRQNLRDLYWASMFILLVSPAFRFAPLGLDQFGFYRISGLFGSHMPYLLMLLVGVVLAGLSALSFQLLWMWQSSGARAERGPLARAVWTVIPPTLLSYAVAVVLSGSIVWIQSTVAMPFLAATLITLLAIQNRQTDPDQGQRRFLLQASFTIVIISSILGAAAIVLVHGAPDLPMALPDHTLFASWEIDFELLGYTQEQVYEGLDVGYVWHSMCTYVYMVMVVGGSLLVAVFRLSDSGLRGPSADTGSDAATLSDHTTRTAAGAGSR